MILAIGSVDEQVRERLARHGPLVEVAPDDRDAIGRRLSDTIGVVARAAAVIDASLIEAAPALRVIGRSGVGVERVDLDAATRRGIPVVVTPDGGTRGVAEGALAPAAVGDLDGATLAVIGFGRIGRRVAELASAFGMCVLAHDPYAGDAPCSLEEALGAADVISLHAPLTAETESLIGEAALRLVKPGAVLINCGRGGLLDLDAAYDALLDGRLSGVGLDVFDPEPPRDHPLFHHPDVALTPHVMALSSRARALVFEEMAAGMDDVLSGRRAPAVANPQVYAATSTATPPAVAPPGRSPRARD